MTKQSSPAKSASNRTIEALLLSVAWLLCVGLQFLVQIAGSPTIPSTVWWVAGILALLFVFAHIVVRRLAPLANPVMLPAIGLLTGIGYSMISRLDSDLADAQGIWIVIGVMAFTVTLFLLRDYRVLDEWRYTAMLIAIVLLFLPLLPGLGREINGSRLWVGIGPLTFQPVEIAKLLLVVFFASYLVEKRELLAIPTRQIGRVGIPDLKHFGPILFFWALSLLILIFENDLGQSLLIFTIFLSMLYIATGRGIFPLVGFGLFLAGTYASYVTFSRVAVRFEGWLDPLNDATITGRTFQVSQSLFALAAGGLFGMGPGLGRPQNIPEAESDFIFAVIGQEIGLVGALAVILLYVLFVAAGLRTALRCTDPFGKMLAAGLSIILGVQAFIILGGVTTLIPLTGITLPFVSYGGSSIVSNFVLVAVVMAVSDQQEAGPRGHSLMRRKPLEVGELVPSGAR